jgi:DNA-binding response OmpR family regulator
MPRILIVEDDPAVRDVLKIALEREGMTVEAVSNGERALKSFRDAGTLDLVILDIMLPDLDGITLCQELRRSSDVPIIQAANTRYEFPDLTIDLSRRQVWVREELVDLTATEFEILSLLAAHPGWVYSRQQIMQQLWDGDFYGEVRSADVHIQRIRKKLEPDPSDPRYIQTVRGIGYKFAEL